MVFEASVMRDLLSNNWTAGNVDGTTPSFYFTGGDVKEHSFSQGDAILIYELAMPPSKAKGIGFPAERREVVLAIDVRTQAGSDRMMKLRDEVDRIRNLKRITPYTGFDLLLSEGERQVASYVNFWHRVMSVRFITYNRAVP